MVLHPILRIPSTLTSINNDIRIKLYIKKSQEPKITQDKLQEWLYKKHKLIISQPAVSRALKKGKKLLESQDVILSQKRDIKGAFPILEGLLVNWIKTRKIPVNAKMIKTKALSLHSTILEEKHIPFKASKGWFEKFKKRNQVKLFKTFGESGSVSNDYALEELAKLNGITKQYNLQDIYNMDESALYYRCNSNTSYGTERKEGTKASKARVTIFFCSNGTGTHKLPIGIINSSKKPMCFRRENTSLINFNYYSSKKGWMNKLVFRQWIRWFDNITRGRNVLLLLDNVSSHKLEDSEISLLSLNNTRIHYLPKNTTSKLQPLDAGIISAFKQNYASKYYQDLNEIDDIDLDDYKIDLLQGIKLSSFIWDTIVTPETIKNCWNHTKIESKEVFGPNIKTTNLYLALDTKYRARIQQGSISKKLAITFILS